jgi:hypothetical protein
MWLNQLASSRSTSRRSANSGDYSLHVSAPRIASVRESHLLQHGLRCEISLRPRPSSSLQNELCRTADSAVVGKPWARTISLGRRVSPSTAIQCSHHRRAVPITTPTSLDLRDPEAGMRGLGIRTPGRSRMWMRRIDTSSMGASSAWNARPPLPR